MRHSFDKIDFMYYQLVTCINVSLIMVKFIDLPNNMKVLYCIGLKQVAL